MRLTMGLLTAALALIATPALAYVDPGLGLGAIGVVVGLILSIVLAIFAFVWMPIKRALGRNKVTEEEATADEG